MIKKILGIFACIMLGVFVVYAQVQAVPAGQFDIIGVLLGVIVTLIAIVGFLTRQSYLELKKEIHEVSKRQNRMDKDIVKITTTLGIEPEPEPE